MYGDIRWMQIYTLLFNLIIKNSNDWNTPQLVSFHSVLSVLLSYTLTAPADLNGRRYRSLPVLSLAALFGIHISLFLGIYNTIFFSNISNGSQ